MSHGPLGDEWGAFPARTTSYICMSVIIVRRYDAFCASIQLQLNGFFQNMWNSSLNTVLWTTEGEGLMPSMFAQGCNGGNTGRAQEQLIPRSQCNNEIKVRGRGSFTVSYFVYMQMDKTSWARCGTGSVCVLCSPGSPEPGCEKSVPESRMYLRGCRRTYSKTFI